VAVFSIAFLFVTMAVHVAIIVVWRYRVPYWDPVLLLYGVFGAAAVVGMRGDPRGIGKLGAQ